MPPIIRADGLSKRYVIGPRAAYATFRDALANAVRSPLGLLRRSQGDAVWALRDASFEIQPGRVTGIIGRNGAGKSTLLKILSRITRPTSGTAVIEGRMASLLEVGTGFHPELTGRHNVFLNGAILGMTRREIARNFDAIVAFADVERFIDTPVKFYSTGMYLRLAFAVAAHLEAEILAVDEVLAVGDLVFQQKCLGKMAEVASGGRTVLLVSHNMAAIHALSDEVLLLDEGRLVRQGTATDTVGAYVAALEGATSGAESSDLRPLHRVAAGEAGFAEGFLNGRPLRARHTAGSGGTLSFELLLDVPEPRRQCFVGINIEDEFGVRVWSLHSRWDGPRFDLAAGPCRVTCSAAPVPVVPGTYHVGLELIAGRERLDLLERVATLVIVESGNGAGTETPTREHGYISSPARWTIDPVPVARIVTAPRE